MRRRQHAIVCLVILFISSHGVSALQKESWAKGSFRASSRALQQLDTEEQEEGDEFLAEEEELEKEFSREEDELDNGATGLEDEGVLEESEPETKKLQQQKSNSALNLVNVKDELEEEAMEEEMEREEEEAEAEQEESGLLKETQEGTGVSSKEIKAANEAALEVAASLVNANITGNSKTNTTAKSKITGTTDLKKAGASEPEPLDESVQRALDVHLNDSNLGKGESSQPTNSKNTTKKGAGVAKGSTEELEAITEGQTGIPKDQSSTSTARADPFQEEEAAETAFLDDDIEALVEAGANSKNIGHPRGSSDTMEENNIKTSNISLSQSTGGGSTQKNSSIMTQGAILGTTIGGMVKDNSSSIAGIVGVLIAGAAGVGVAFAGISLWRRFRDRRAGGSGKGLPRIIEIGALSGRKQKSPSYSRVNDKNQDQQGYSGTQWPETDDGWDNTGHPDTGVNGSSVKHKKAWDWDADW